MRCGSPSIRWRITNRVDGSRRPDRHEPSGASPTADPGGRRAWLFCWTEVGAEKVGIIQSLITTCVLHGVDPYTYLVDVLQRVATHPQRDVADLTPRLWKEEKFTDQALPSTTLSS